MKDTSTMSKRQIKFFNSIVMQEFVKVKNKYAKK